MGGGGGWKFGCWMRLFVRLGLTLLICWSRFFDIFRGLLAFVSLLLLLLFYLFLFLMLFH